MDGFSVRVDKGFRSAKRIIEMRRSAQIVALSVTLAWAATGCVEQRCFEDLDCPAPKLCGPAGACVYQCIGDGDCPEGFVCRGHRCEPEPVGPITCPDDMVAVADTFCADVYEASRPDATRASAGSDNACATSRAEVIPWQIANNAAAEAACQAAGKRLCTPEEWLVACQGPNGTEYAYGDQYDPTICNGIDAFGPGRFHLMPTGSFPDCTNAWGVFDINGNLWEHTANGSNRTIRGGAFNCGDSAALHRCRYIPGSWEPSARGFRCCLTPVAPQDGGQDGQDGGVGPGDLGQGDGGCVVTDGEDGAVEDAGDEAGDDGGQAEDDGGAGGEDGGLAGDDGGQAEDDGGQDGGVDPTEPCPEEMVELSGFCMDRHEASRPDATESDQGVDGSRALSRPGVLPWHVAYMNRAVLTEFQAACEAAGKRLCTREEFLLACQGTEGRTYFFGETWDREICNSVDSFCDEHCLAQGIEPCNLSENCGYQYYCFHLVPTGSFPGCRDEHGLYDVNGNVWEIVPSSSARGYEVRGGAFNCGAPSARFVCTFDATWDALYAGFRCCRDRKLP
jgi:formylglycine-generating enzyme required for sulfatase activity